MSHRIHIICSKPQICFLIKKALIESDYLVSCTSGENIDENSITEFKERIDCLILDKNIENKIREKIREKFEGISIICLPSLESDTIMNRDIRNMSEPFKLSELKREIEQVFQKSVT